MAKMGVGGGFIPYLGLVLYTQPQKKFPSPLNPFHLFRPAITFMAQAHVVHGAQTPSQTTSGVDSPACAGKSVGGYGAVGICIVDISIDLACFAWGVSRVNRW